MVKMKTLYLYIVLIQVGWATYKVLHFIGYGHFFSKEIKKTVNKRNTLF